MGVIKKAKLLKKKIAIASYIFIIFICVSFIVTISVMIMGSLSNEDDYNLDELMLGLPEILTEEMVIGAIENERNYGVPSSLTLAQIVLESGGNYPGHLSGLAYFHKNLFGIKGVGSAGTTIQETKEYEGGLYQTSAGFRKYYNFKESISDHGKLLTSPRYKTYTSKIKETDKIVRANKWASAIFEAGYATDPSYVDKLIRIMTTHDLYVFNGMDEETAKAYLEGDGKYGGSLIWPLAEKGIITSVFGDRDIPIAGATANHNAVDIAVPSGTYIKAAEGGQVIFSGWYGTGGNAVIIKHGEGIETHYYHQSKILSKNGQKVSKGQIIGRVGSTGASTGPHLHFGFKLKGKWVDPLKYVKAN